MIHQQEWHTNHGTEGYTSVYTRLGRLLTFTPGYNHKEAALAIAALPEILKDYRELIAIVEKTNPDRAKKSKQVLKKAGQ